MFLIDFILIGVLVLVWAGFIVVSLLYRSYKESKQESEEDKLKHIEKVKDCFKSFNEKLPADRKITLITITFPDGEKRDVGIYD